MAPAESDFDPEGQGRLHAGDPVLGFVATPDTTPPPQLRRPIVAALLDSPIEPSPSPFHGPLIDLCYERGFAALTIDQLCRRARLGPDAFDALYSDLEDCLLQVLRTELARYHRRAAAARDGLREWRSRLRATTYALYRYLAEDERLRRFASVEARAAGPRAALLIVAEARRLFELIDEGRAEPTAAPGLTDATAESLSASILNELFLTAARGSSMPPEEELVPGIMYSAVLPYLGVAAAEEELRVPPPPLALV